MYVKDIYVCLGKQTYLEKKGMYVCLGEHTNLETRGMYVCMLRVCMHVWGNIHTLFSEVTRYLAGIPCLPPHLGMYVCMYLPKL